MTSSPDFLFFTLSNASAAPDRTTHTTRNKTILPCTQQTRELRWSTGAPRVDMNAGRVTYKTILQIYKQYCSSRLPLTGIVGFSQSRFRYPIIHAVKEAFNVQRDNPDLDCKSAVQRMLTCFCPASHLSAGVMSLFIRSRIQSHQTVASSIWCAHRRWSSRTGKQLLPQTQLPQGCKA